jgi:phosphotransacetylase
MALSKAAKREREAVQELRDAVDKIYRASSKFRTGTSAVMMSGELNAAANIVESVAHRIDERTQED